MAPSLTASTTLHVADVTSRPVQRAVVEAAAAMLLLPQLAAAVVVDTQVVSPRRARNHPRAEKAPSQDTAEVKAPSLDMAAVKAQNLDVVVIQDTKVRSQDEEEVVVVEVQEDMADVDHDQEVTTEALHQDGIVLAHRTEDHHHQDTGMVHQRQTMVNSARMTAGVMMRAMSSATPLTGRITVPISASAMVATRSSSDQSSRSWIKVLLSVKGLV
jgi:hypothetical protein